MMRPQKRYIQLFEVALLVKNNLLFIVAKARESNVIQNK